MKAYEMKDSGVEWIEQVPKGWKIKRGKYILKLLSRPITDADEIVTCFRDGEVTLRKNRREEGFTNALLECGYQGVEPGDLVVHGMDGFAGAIGISDSRGKSSPVLNVLDSSEHKRFVMYYLRALALRDVFMGLSTGIRVRSCDLRWNKLAVLPYLLPPLPEQQAIASYLDEKCAAIDDIVARAKETIEEYKQWKASVIFEAVTKGLDKNAEMKDSETEWLGQIPKEWKRAEIGSLYSLRNTKVSDRDYAALSVTKKGILPQLETVAKTDDGDNRKLVRKGDFAINSRSDRRGSCGISDYDGSVSLINTVLTPRDAMHPGYYNWLFHTEQFADEFYKWGHGIVDDLWTTRWSEMKSIIVPTPPLPEQRAIASYLDDKCAAIDAVVARKQSLIEELESYKKSLIFEVVTGKRRVC